MTLSTRAELTPALRCFLDRTDVPTPYVVIDIDIAEQRYHELAAAIPGAAIFYAVKANPAMPLLERLVSIGSSFDVASPAEIDRCLAAGASPDRISYGNTIKKRRDIAYATSCGVRRFSVDVDTELEKIADAAPGAEVCVRLRHDCGGADWPLSRKFGADAADVTRVLLLAAEADMRLGVSFHVGSQQRDLLAWDDTLEVVAGIANRIGEHGHALDFLNLGGGYPGTSWKLRHPSTRTAPQFATRWRSGSPTAHRN